MLEIMFFVQEMFSVVSVVLFVEWSPVFEIWSLGFIIGKAIIKFPSSLPSSQSSSPWFNILQRLKYNRACSFNQFLKKRHRILAQKAFDQRYIIQGQYQ